MDSPEFCCSATAQNIRSPVFVKWSLTGGGRLREVVAMHMRELTVVLGPVVVQTLDSAMDESLTSG